MMRDRTGTTVGVSLSDALIVSKACCSLNRADKSLALAADLPGPTLVCGPIWRQGCAHCAHERDSVGPAWTRHPAVPRLSERQVELLDRGLEVAGRDHGAKYHEAVPLEDVRCASVQRLHELFEI
jgi:hypothetical protein